MSSTKGGSSQIGVGNDGHGGVPSSSMYLLRKRKKRKGEAKAFNCCVDRHAGRHESPPRARLMLQKGVQEATSRRDDLRLNLRQGKE